MIRLTHSLTLVCLLYGVLVTSPRVLNAKHLQGMKRWELAARGPNTEGEARRATDTAAPAKVRNITFSNPKASRAYARLRELASFCLTRLQSSMWMVRPFLKSSLTPVHHGLAFSLSAEHRMRQDRCGFIQRSSNHPSPDSFLAILLVLPSWTSRKHRRPYSLVRFSLYCRLFRDKLNSACYRLSGGPGCSSLEGMLKENGVSSH